jgi:hypothetical protein
MLSVRGEQLAQEFERTGDPETLGKAIECASRAVRSTSPGDDMYLSRLHNLGTLFGRKYESTGAIQDLNESIRLLSSAVAGTPEYHPYRASRLISLATWLGRRYERNGEDDDFENALQQLSHAVEIGWRFMDYSTYLMNVVNLFAWKFRWTSIAPQKLRIPAPVHP